MQLRLNVGGEGEEPDCINQQPSTRDLNGSISRANLPSGISILLDYSRQGIPFLFCQNNSLPFPDDTVDIVFTNNVPIDQGNNYWFGPTVSSTEIKRVLKSGGEWFDNSVLVHQKP